MSLPVVGLAVSGLPMSMSIIPMQSQLTFASALCKNRTSDMSSRRKVVV